MPIKVKICCISSPNEARMAIQCGASALGLVAAMPSGPGVIGDASIKAIAAAIPPPIASFLLTSEIEPDAIIAHHQRTGTSTIQLVDAVAAPSYRLLRAALPGIQLVQVIHVLDEASVDEALRCAEHVDALC